MIITERDMSILHALARYGLLGRRHLQQLCFPDDVDGRVARRRLAALTEAGMIQRHAMLVARSYDEYPAAVYLLSEKGCRHLAEVTGNAQYLHKPVQIPHLLHLRHHLAVAELHMLLDAALAAETSAVLEAWYNEGDVINSDEPDRRHYRLHTKFQGDRGITCSPDAGFLLRRAEQRTAFYLEMERGVGGHRTGARQLAGRKCPGYAELARRQLYLRHFPSADGFYMLLVARDRRHRDAVRQAFRQAESIGYRTDLWRFAAWTDITPGTFLRGEIFYSCDDQLPAPLPFSARVSTPGHPAHSWRPGAQVAAVADVAVTEMPRIIPCDAVAVGARGATDKKNLDG